MIRNMTMGAPWKHLVMFSLPLLVGNLFQQAYNLADSIIVGNYVGPNALGAVGTSGSILFFLISLMIGIGVGSSIIISQLFGAGEMERLKKAFATIMIATVLVGIAISILGYFLTVPFLRLLNTPEELMADSTEYLHILMVGLIFSVLYNSLSGILRGLGNSKTPLYFLMICCFINIGLDLLFVAVFQLGVAGVAYATTIAQGISAIMCIIYFYKKVGILRPGKGNWRISKDMLRATIHFGVPAGIQQASISLGLMVLQGVINSFGTAVIAGFASASKIDMFAVMPMLSLNSAISTFAAQNAGAKEFGRVKAGLKSSFLICIVVSAIMTTIILIFNRPLVGLFYDPKEVEVIEIAVNYMSVMSIFYFMLGFMHCFMGVLSGSGDINFSMVMSIALTIARIPLSYLFAFVFDMGYMGIVWTYPVSQFIATAVGFFRFRTGKWKTKTLLKNEADMIPEDNPA